MFLNNSKIRISTQDKRMIEKLGSRGTYKGVIDRSLHRAAKHGVANMKRVLTIRDNRWIEGGDKLYKSIRPVRKSWKYHGISIIKAGVYLDSMNPHFVSFRHKKVYKWWITKGGGKDNKLKTPKLPGFGIKNKFPTMEGLPSISFKPKIPTKKKPKGIFVKPHPFIDHALRIVNPRIPYFVNDELRKALRGM